MNRTTQAFVSGAFVLWDASATDHETLLAKLGMIGMEKFCPPPRSIGGALKKTLTDYAADMKKSLGASDRKHDLIVQAHKKRIDGFEVVEVARGATENDYTPRFSAKIEVSGDGASEMLRITKGSANLVELSERYRTYRREITGSDVGRSLVEILTHLHGTCVRTVGGVYYLPEDAVSQWDDVVAAYESAGTNTVHRVRIVLDDQAIRTVKRAITRELTTRAGTLAEEIKNCQLSDESLEARQIEAKALRERAKKYEEILNTQLAECHAVINLAETAASSAMAVQEDRGVFGGMYAS